MRQDTGPAPPACRLPGSIQAALAAVPPGLFTSRILYYDEVGSTNDLAARAADAGAPEGTVIVAGAQRSGRGRLGRSWFSPPGSGLYVSAIIRPSGEEAALAARPSAPGFSAITLVAGVALAEAIERASGLPVAIKWPNDLVVGRRKLGGILAEASADAGSIRYVILGFGINLRATAFPPELVDRATSLEGELGRPVDGGAVLATSLDRLGRRYADARGGGVQMVLDRWRELAPSSVGARVRWTGPAGPIEGVTQGIDGQGALLVASGEGLDRVIAGEVVWL